MPRSTATPSRKACHPGSRFGQPGRMMAQTTLSWSSWAPEGPCRFPPSCQRTTLLNERFLRYREVARFSQPRACSTAGRFLPPGGSGMTFQSRTQASRAPTECGPPMFPRAGSVWGSCADGAVASHAVSTRGSFAAGAAAICAVFARTSHAAVAGSWRGGGGLGGDQGPHGRV